jgi:hypothetical protein
VVVELLLASALASPLEFELWLFWKNGIRILLLRVCGSLRGVEGNGPAVATPHISSGLYDMQVGIDENRLERGWSHSGVSILIGSNQIRGTDLDLGGNLTINHTRHP